MNLKQKHSNTYLSKKVKITPYSSDFLQVFKQKSINSQPKLENYSKQETHSFTPSLSKSFSLENPDCFAFKTVTSLKFENRMKKINKQKENRFLLLKEVQANEELQAKKLANSFKARPIPDYKYPLKPMKSMKKLTVPIEPIFQTDLRANTRQRSKSVYKD